MVLVHDRQILQFFRPNRLQLQGWNFLRFETSFIFAGHQKNLITIVTDVKY
jgi:very-short-patch-repair endonuclease